MTVPRVLFLARTARGGSAFSLYHLAKGLERSQYAPVIAFYALEQAHIVDLLQAAQVPVEVMGALGASLDGAGTPTAKKRDIAAKLDVRLGRWAGETYRLLKGAYQFLRKDVPLIAPTMRVIRKVQPALIHFNNGLRPSKPVAVAAWLTRTPLVCHVRSFEHLGPFDRLFSHFVSQFIYISRAVEQHSQQAGLPATQGQVIHNALEVINYQTSSETAAEVKSEFSWLASAPVVGIVGRLDWWKGHEYFLQALALVKQTLPAVRGLIIGEPEHTPENAAYSQKLLALTETLGLQETVRFTGFRKDVPRLLTALEVMVLGSSEPEPFGRVVIEAMAAERPVIATAAGGVLDIIEHGVNGWLIPAKDTKAMAQALTKVLGEPDLARRLGQAARQTVEERFTLTTHVERVQAVYDVVLQKKTKAALPLSAAKSLSA